MTKGGTHKPGSESDPSDWRTAPNFSGLFEVATPAYPNPVSYNAVLTMTIYVKALNAVQSLKIYAFRQPGNLQPISSITPLPRPLHQGTYTIKIMPSQFAPAGGTGNFGDIYRIIFLDGQNRIITYGDVRVK